MRRFIIVCCAIFALAWAGVYAYATGALYLPAPDAGEIRTRVRARGGDIELDAGEGFEPFQIKGIDLSSSIPGSFPSDFAVGKQDWLRWFGLIQDSGANTIRVYTVLDSSFYRALREFNALAPKGAELYLLQGVTIDDYAQDSHMDAFDDGYLGAAKSAVHDAIDAVHGVRPLATGRLNGLGSYTSDVSAWTLGYVIGEEWVGRTVAYTNKIHDGRSSFEGAYLKTAPSAAPFEAALAEIGDEVLRYETDRFGEQRLVVFSNGESTDPLPWPDDIRIVYGNPVGVDTEHIRATAAVASGTATCYQVGVGACDLLYSCSNDELAALGVDPTLVDAVRGGDTLGAYLDLLDRHHTGPVLAGRLGSSSARLVDHSGATDPLGGISESDQARSLVERVRIAQDTGLAGALVFEWQDDWSARSLNTLAVSDQLKAPRWHDLQTAGQCYGLLSFDAADDARCELDGDPVEWDGAVMVARAAGLRVRAMYDEAFLRLLVEGEDVDGRTPIHLFFDTIPGIGASACGDIGLTFDSGVDFLLVVAGSQDSRLLVQERYEVERVTTLREALGQDPYLSAPAPDSESFVSIDTPFRKPPLPSEVHEIAQSTAGAAHRIGADRFWIVETGRMAVRSDAVSSDRADIAYGSGCVEIRIPWGLLNFSNPSQMQVHDDYYAHYGVENLVIDSIGIGVYMDTAEGLEGGSIASVDLGRFPLEGWGGRISYRERLKPAYYALAELWGGEAA